MSRHKAVVLAAGLGSRMRQSDSAVPLNDAQQTAADNGQKTMMPFEAPFLDYVISGLADAGFSDVCLVVAPDHLSVRRRYSLDRPPTRIRVSFAIQARALGTADAVISAESFVAGDSFVVVNGDNYYPVEVLRALRDAGCPAIAGFDRSTLASDANFDAGRLNRFGLIRCDSRGTLTDLIEKPDDALLASAGPDALISMNCWAFDSRIFRACALVTRSTRGELELPEAARTAVARLGVAFKVLPFALPVFDLSNRSDVPSMARRLATIRPRL